MLGQALCWPLTREQHRHIPSPLSQKALKYPRTKEGTRRNSTFTQFYSYQITLLDLKGHTGPLERRVQQPPPTPRVQEPSLVLGIGLALSVLPFPEPKRQRSGTNVKLPFVWEFHDLCFKSLYWSGRQPKDLPAQTSAFILKLPQVRLLPASVKQEYF